jgi:serine phosphatase RsbU (regulator of sigma subunit)
LTEAQNGRGEDFGLERLADLVLRLAGSAPTALFGAVHQEIDGFLAGRTAEDDITLDAIKAK